MNVRFFAGTKADYLSLPSPRNPLGLYFCEDTKELYWADRLLTDGIRVVPTFADLPTRADAIADGIIYYVTETRNGYVISPDRTQWLQTIYAPATDAYKVPESEIYNTVTTVGAVRDIEAKIYKTIDERIANIEIGTLGTGIKAIYFAGRKLDAHEDGTYHIDRLCALRALGFNVPEDIGDKELELVTKDYVDELIAKIPGSDIDLSDYVKQEDIVDFATKKELQEAINSIEHPTVDLNGYATEEWINKQGFLKEHQDLSEYAKKSDIPEAELFVVDFNAPDFAAAIEAYNSGKLLLLVNATPDANSYAVMNYVRDDMITFTKFLTSRSETYGSFNTYYLHSDNTWEVSKEVKLNKVEAVTDADKISGIIIGKETYTFDYATTKTVNDLTQSIANTYVTNETLEQNYVNNEYITKNYTTTEDIKATYVTNNDVTKLVTNEINTVVSEQIENKITEVIENKIEDGNLVVNADAINYDTW